MMTICGDKPKDESGTENKTNNTGGYLQGLQTSLTNVRNFGACLGASKTNTTT